MKSFFTVLIGCAFIFLVSCEKNDDPLPQILMAQESLTLSISQAGGHAAFNISVNAPWTVSTGADKWFTADRLSGDAGQFSLKVYALEDNADKTAREGTLTISAGKAMASVSVFQPGRIDSVRRISLNKMRLVLDIGEKETLVIKSLPEYANERGVVWSSADPEIAAVDPKSGEVIGIGNGTTTVQVASVAYPDVKTICTVKVEGMFPDDAFRDLLLRIGFVETKNDIDPENQQNKEKFTSVETLLVFGSDIASLRGIEYFTALKELDCSQNDLLSVDLSSNTQLEKVNCVSCDINSLTLPENSKIYLLRCAANDLTKLDVTNCPLLDTLDCGSNKIASLDVTNCPGLHSLKCSNNRLSALDLSKNEMLSYLGCNDNQISSLDVSKNGSLNRFDCSENKLSELDIRPLSGLENGIYTCLCGHQLTEHFTLVLTAEQKSKWEKIWSKSDHNSDVTIDVRE